MIKIACNDCGGVIGYTFNSNTPVIVCPYCGSKNTYAELEPTVMTDDNTEEVVNHPSHYTQGDIECIDAIDSAFGHEMTAIYCAITAFTYIWRHRVKHPSPIIDLQKAQWFTEKAIHYYELHEEEQCSRS